jgi:hypothetical protein
MNLASKTAPVVLHPAVEGGAHPSDRRMPHLLLDADDEVTGIGLVPASIEILGSPAELDNEVA